MTNLERISFEKFIEKSDTAEVAVAAEQFEVYLESLDLPDNEKRKLSNLRSVYGESCKKKAFLNGYAAGLDLIKQVVILFIRNEIHD